MRNNFLFAALLVIILTVGLYFDPISSFLAEDRIIGGSVIVRDENQGQAIYLTAKKMPSPMEFFDFGRSQPVKGLNDRRSAAAALAAVMSRCSDSTIIPVEEGEKLINQWRINSQGFFCVSHWKHLNIDNEVQYMDCVIDPDGLVLYYIRFYSEDEPKLSAYDMNAALDRLDGYTNNFFGNAQQYLTDLETVTTYDYDEVYSTTSYINLNSDYYLRLTEHENPETDYYTLYNCFKERYELMVDLLIENALDTPLGQFWLAPLGLVKVYSGWSESDIIMTTLQRISNSGSPITASYTAQSGRIWQTVALQGGGSITMIYNIAGDDIEGFFIQ